MKVKLDDILEAFELNDRYSEYFLDEETGEVVQVNDMMMTQDEKAEIYDRLDEHGFLRLPSDIAPLCVIDELLPPAVLPCREHKSGDLSGDNRDVKIEHFTPTSYSSLT